MNEAISTIEERLYRTEVSVEERADSEGGGLFFRGQGIVYNQPSRPLYDEKKGPFIEIIEAGAVDKDTDVSEVLAVFNHDENRLLGANYSGTLTFDSNDAGVDVRILKPNNSVGNDCEEWVRRKDIRGMSFKFRVGKDRWETKDNILYRYVSKISQLLDLSLVTRAAYMQTSVGMAVRSYALFGNQEQVIEDRMSKRSQSTPSPLSESDKAFMAGMVDQLQVQVDFISQGISKLTDKRIKQLAASRLSDLIYTQSWFQEVQADMLAIPETETPETPSDAETNAARSAQGDNPEPEQRSLEYNTPDSDPLAWYKAKNNVHHNSLQLCQ